MSFEVAVSDSNRSDFADTGRNPKIKSASTDISIIGKRYCDRGRIMISLFLRYRELQQTFPAKTTELLWKATKTLS
jgi:hypothetical protein